jgi:hypothetical protein
MMRREKFEMHGGGSSCRAEPTFGRTLPVRVAPLPGEALDSWLEAIAFRYKVPMGDVMSWCGIEPTPQTTFRLLSPSRDERRRVSTVCGVDGEKIRSMTMDQYRARTADADHWPSALWARRARSRFCPHCLCETGGRWRLVWRLNWSFACLKHRCLLADTCPECHSAQRRQLLCPSRIPQPGRCRTVQYSGANHQAGPCNADLGAADVLQFPGTHSVLTAQATIHDLLDGNRTNFALYGAAAPPCETALSDVRALAQWIMCAVRQVHLDNYLSSDLSSALARHRESMEWPLGPYRRGTRIVAPAVDTAAGVVVALRVISLPDITATVSTLQRLMDNADNGGPYRTPFSRRAGLSPALTAVLDVALAADKADRKLQSRIARKLAAATAVRSASNLLAR